MNYNFDLVASTIMNYDFDLVASSDPGDATTASTTLFSDDTKDKSNRSTNPKTGMSIQQLHEFTAVAGDASEEPPGAYATDCWPDVPGISDRQTRHCSSGLKNSELRIGESSAFFSYVKIAIQKSNIQGTPQVQNNAATQLRMEDTHQTCPQQEIHDLKTHENGEPCVSPYKEDLPGSISNPECFSIDNSSAPPSSMGMLSQKNFNEHLPQDAIHPRNGSHISEIEVPDSPSQHAYPYFISGFFNHVLMPSSAQMYPKNHQDYQNQANATMIAQYNDISHCLPDANGITSFPYYPMTVCLQPGQMPSGHPWPSFRSSSSFKAEANKVDKRAEALIKFRKKRKERCFDNKIRYVNWKQLTERRPCVSGQFVKKLNGVNVDLNRQPASVDYDEEEEEEDEENNVRDSSPEDA